MKRKTRKFQGIGWTVLSAVMFGFNPLFSKTIYRMGGNPFMITWVRLAVTAVGMMFVFKVIHPEQTIKVTGNELKKLFICSQGYSFTPLLMYASYNYISSGVATTIHFVYPILVLIGSMIFLREKMGWVKRISCVLCFLGIFFLGNSGGQIRAAGLGLAFASALTFAVYIVYLAGSGLQAMNPAKLAAWLSVIGAIEVFIVVLITRNMVWDLSSGCILFMCLFGAVSGCLASTFFQMGTKLIGAASASMLSTFEPLTSIIVGAVVYKEVITVKAVAGIFCILAAVLMVAGTELKTDQNS